MIKDYVFEIAERSTGYVVVRSDHFPSGNEVMDEINKGNACYDETEYEKVAYVSESPVKPKEDLL
ncbi:MAG: hypothetical protein E7544_09140 [Ruminococcaceae bacterium]|nr:hypothetical protein [Oscillospiraceae bacterium]